MSGVRGLDDLWNMLLYLEAGNVELLDGDTIATSMTTEKKPKTDYTIFFSYNNEDVKFESVVIDAPTIPLEDQGNPWETKIGEFCLSLLSANDHLSPLTFALGEFEDGSYAVMLIGSQEKRSLDLVYLKRVLDCYEQFYRENYHLLHVAASQLQLSAEGKLPEGFTKIMRFIFPEF